MPSRKRFRIGEQVCYPQITLGRDGKHEVVKMLWQIKTIFPVSQMAILTQADRRAGVNVQVGLDRLANYN